MVARIPTPMAALAVNMAVTPAGFAFLVGSGFSRSAGVPSAWDVLRDITARWYAAETGTPVAADIDPIGWAGERLGADATYSTVLEQLFPERAQRQELLASYFVGKEPTPAHRILARMAVAGLVRVVVTTNFDRLIEAALDDVGVRWSRVSSDAELATAQPRDVAPVFILKLHGDYGSIDMRNTTDEISAIDPGVGAELAAILRSHGLVVVGYAGTDPAVAQILRSTRPRLGLYWAVRGSASSEQSDLLRAVDGYEIQIEDADAFMPDLLRRIDAISASPSAQLPIEVYRETLALIRRGDLIGLREAIKRHGSATIGWYRDWRERISEANLDWRYSPSWGLTEWHPRIDRFCEELGPSIEELIAVGMPLVEYRREDVPSFLQWIDRLLAECRTPRGGRPPTVEGACADLAYACVLELMAAALALRAWPSLEVLMTWPDSGGRSATLGLSSSFHHYAFFDTYATWLPHAHQQLLGQSEV
jgi:SIR2-like domain